MELYRGVVLARKREEVEASALNLDSERDQASAGSSSMGQRSLKRPVRAIHEEGLASLLDWAE